MFLVSRRIYVCFSEVLFNVFMFVCTFVWEEDTERARAKEGNEKVPGRIPAYIVMMPDVDSFSVALPCNLKTLCLHTLY